MRDFQLWAIVILLYCLLLTNCTDKSNRDIYFQLEKIKADTSDMRDSVNKIRRDVSTLNDKVDYK